MALIRAFDATSTGLGTTIETVIELGRIVTGHIDASAQHELNDLVGRLRLYYDHTSQQ